MHSVYVRLALYVISTLLGLLPAALAQWGVIYDPVGQTITIELVPLVTAVFAGFAMSAGVLRRWGVR